MRHIIEELLRLYQLLHRGILPSEKDAIPTPGFGTVQVPGLVQSIFKVFAPHDS